MSAALKYNATLDEILRILDEYKACGGTQDDAYSILEAIREEEKKDSTLEDRILEVMDFVSGFCSKDKRIWK